MISLVSGDLVSARETERGCEAVIDTGGIGYSVSITPATLSHLSSKGGRVVLHTHLHVREEEMSLYGFENPDERDLFEVLIGATGVGPKVALAILATHSPRAIRTLVSANDVDALTLVPGIGVKRAQKLLLELRDRVGGAPLEAVPTMPQSVTGDVAAALAGLGYAPAEIRQALDGLDPEGDPSLMLREALRHLGQTAKEA